jgi:hypothetical protein
MDNLQVKIIRFETGIDGTFGVMLKNNSYFCMTLEPEWKNNQKTISCIPQGKYLCQKKESIKFGNVYEVLNVENRNDILFHVGNFAEDTQGCILLGQTIKKEKGEKSLFLSKDIVATFNSLPYKNIDLQIINLF